MNSTQVSPINTNDLVANVFRVYKEEYTQDEEFMLGWRLWSFNMTKEGQSTSFISVKDYELIQSMKTKGNLCKIESKQKLNSFRSSILRLFPAIDPKMHYYHQYRLIFQKVAFAVVDCCFAVKYKPNDIHALLTEMFRQSGTSEMPSHFILINNHIMDSELDYKIGKSAHKEYLNTQIGINAYRRFKPTMAKNCIQKTYVPFTMSHDAMLKAELKAQKKIQMMDNQTVNRASINDYAQMYLIDQLRRSFGQCSRVALLSDDHRLIKTASNFVPHVSKNNIYAGLPEEYLKTYIITPSVLSEEYWLTWRDQNVHPEFAKQIGAYHKNP